MNIYKQIKYKTFEKFDELDDSNPNEMTVIASISLVDENNVILCSFGSGSKGVGKKDLQNSYRLHSCHAEVIAKRGFQIWIYQNLEKYFVKNNQIYELDKRFKIAMYISQPPCGECQIIPQSQIYGLSAAKPLEYFETDMPNFIIDPKRLRSIPCKLETPIDNRCPSFCCSDKIMLWTVLGIQGSLLSQIIKPIYLDYIIIEYREQYSIKNGINILKRSNCQIQDILYINQRRISNKFKLKIPKIIYTRKKLFKKSPYNEIQDNLTNKRVKQTNQDVKFNSKSILFVEPSHVEKINSQTGLTWGMANKSQHIIKFLPQITKYKLFQLFKQHQDTKLTYYEQKQQSRKYHFIKNRIQNLFREWTQDKSHFEQFQ
ncbi:hypothetical protein pb186bvf_012233 [Paramecium bursaria]